MIASSPFLITRANDCDCPVTVADNAATNARINARTARDAMEYLAEASMRIAKSRPARPPGWWPFDRKKRPPRRFCTTVSVGRLRYWGSRVQGVQGVQGVLRAAVPFTGPASTSDGRARRS